MYFTPSIVPVHPTPLYDSISHLGIFIFLLYYPNYLKPYVKRGTASLLLVSFVCIIVEIVRNNPPILWQMSLAQWVYTVIILGIISKYFYTLKMTNNTPPINPFGQDMQ